MLFGQYARDLAGEFCQHNGAFYRTTGVSAVRFSTSAQLHERFIYITDDTSAKRLAQIADIILSGIVEVDYARHKFGKTTAYSDPCQVRIFVVFSGAGYRPAYRKVVDQLDVVALDNGRLLFSTLFVFIIEAVAETHLVGRNPLGDKIRMGGKFIENKLLFTRQVYTI